MIDLMDNFWLLAVAVSVAWTAERLMGAVYFAPNLFGKEWILAYRGSIPKNLMQILFPLLYDMAAALILQIFLAFLLVQTGSLWVILFAFTFHITQFKSVSLLAKKTYRIMVIDTGYLILVYGCSALIYYILLF